MPCIINKKKHKQTTKNAKQNTVKIKENAEHYW